MCILTLHSATILALAVFASGTAGYIPVGNRVIQLTVLENKNKVVYILYIQNIMSHEGYTGYRHTLYIGNREAVAGRCMYNLYVYKWKAAYYNYVHVKYSSSEISEGTYETMHANCIKCIIHNTNMICNTAMSPTAVICDIHVWGHCRT